MSAEKWFVKAVKVERFSEDGPAHPLSFPWTRGRLSMIEDFLAILASLKPEALRTKLYFCDIIIFGGFETNIAVYLRILFI